MCVSPRICFLSFCVRLIVILPQSHPVSLEEDPSQSLMSISKSPSLDLCLATLHELLHPSPILSLLLSALDLSAHFQLFAQQLSSDAALVAALHEKHYYMMHESGINEEEEISKGYLLDSSEGEKVKHIRYRKEGIFDASIRLRKHHIATSLAMVKRNPRQVKFLIDLYFPDIDPEDHSYRKDERIFISCMKRSQARMMLEGRKTVIKWYKDAIEVFDAHEPPLPYRTFFYGETSSVAHGRALSQALLEECQEIVQEARDFEALLAGDGSWQGEKWTSSKRKGRDVRRYTMTAIVTDSKSTDKSPPVKPARQPRVSLPANLDVNINSPPATDNDKRTTSPPSDSESVRARTLPRLSFSSSSIRKASGAWLRDDNQAEAERTPSRAPVQTNAQKAVSLIGKTDATSPPPSRMTYPEKSPESPKRQSRHPGATDKRVILPVSSPSSPSSPRTKAAEPVKANKETESEWAAKERRVEEARLRRSLGGAKLGDGGREGMEIGATPATPAQKPETPTSLHIKTTSAKKKRPRQSFPLSGPEFSRDAGSGIGSAKKRPKIIE
ncbi:hypothetical protein J007_06945 [Cryptococcus neoformans]|nr:hypothetical protein J007_06945 [Cryptococcus neoformans var. grubii]OXC57528.1 hypothetical protein C358_07028 [Cryptococcus neoformans var. grubii MW-RSA852]